MARPSDYSKEIAGEIRERIAGGHQKTGKKTTATCAPKPKPAAAPSLPATPPAPHTPKESVAYCPPPDELDHSVPTLRHLGGAKSDKWNLLLCNQVLNAAWYHRNSTEQEKADQHTAILGFLAGVNPKDALEGMMAAQLFASHAAAMECYRRAMLPDQSAEGRQTNLAQAAKLTRANAAQIEALAKHRGKGQQKVIVEHVHVYQGGQAIVGNVAPGGDGKNNEVQPHAVTCAQSATMRSENPERKALPVPRDAQRTLQDARRPIAGRT
jgi:hypothetical protein